MTAVVPSGIPRGGRSWTGTMSSPELSVAAGAARLTLVSLPPASRLRPGRGSPASTGGVVSTTVTCCTAAAVLPELSDAVQLTGVVPIGMPAPGRSPAGAIASPELSVTFGGARITRVKRPAASKGPAGMIAISGAIES